jgi:site-specific recombinase XerD
MNVSSLPALLQSFFTARLITQLGASSHTVAAYRDTFRLLLRFATERLKQEPSELRMEQFDTAFVGDFLQHLEVYRGNCTRTRNIRLAALRAFFRYVAVNEPAHALQCQRLLAMPSKRYERGPVEFLTDEEVAALAAAPDPDTWLGRRDKAILVVAAQTGLRNSELTGLRHRDVEFGAGAHVRCLGKGRKARCTPLAADTATVLKKWLAEQSGGEDSPVFPSSRGGRISADALQRLVACHAATASECCPSLKGKKVTPHTLRHTAAMALLLRGVGLTVIALWLGHESTETTQVYMHADMSLKERALAHSTSTGAAPKRYHPPDPLLAFLEGL